MSQEIESIEHVFPQLGRFLDQIQSSLPTLDDPRKSAVRAVWRAVDQTKMHLAAIRDGRAGRADSNSELVRLWSDAALAISDVDIDFAGRLRMKAEYWSDPRYWHDEPSIDISIDSVAQTARALLPLATRRLPVQERSAAQGIRRPVNPDVFISHASEDKEDVARPLADELRRHRYTVWLDEYTLRLGDSLRRRIDEGLGSSRYGVVILSPSFFQKPWPQRELDGLIALETADGRKRVLPVWHNLTADMVARYSPILADRLAVSTSLGIEVVVSQIIDVMEGEVGRSTSRGQTV
jgi:hypothetical protein